MVVGYGRGCEANRAVCTGVVEVRRVADHTPRERVPHLVTEHADHTWVVTVESPRVKAVHASARGAHGHSASTS